MALKVSDIGEKGLINYILTKSEDIVADDTAITEFKDTNLISTCDMLIESKHFPEGMSYFQMGFKAVTVNVSDLAAMGADPFCRRTCPRISPCSRRPWAPCTSASVRSRTQENTSASPSGSTPPSGQTNRSGLKRRRRR